MSGKAVVVKIDSVKPHPNADRLEIVSAGGFTSIITGVGSFTQGELAILLEPDTYIPPNYIDNPYLQACGFPLRTGRVRAIKLRNVWSEGLLLPHFTGLSLGEDVTELLNVSTPEATVSTRVNMVQTVAGYQGKCKTGIGGTILIQSYAAGPWFVIGKAYPEILRELWGEEKCQLVKPDTFYEVCSNGSSLVEVKDADK